MTVSSPQCASGTVLLRLNPASPQTGFAASVSIETDNRIKSRSIDETYDSSARSPKNSPTLSLLMIVSSLDSGFDFVTRTCTRRITVTLFLFYDLGSPIDLSPRYFQCYNCSYFHSSQMWRLKRCSDLFITDITAVHTVDQRHETTTFQHGL